MACDAATSFTKGDPPDWVRDWQGRRRSSRSSQPNAGPAHGEAGRIDLAEAEFKAARAGERKIGGARRGPAAAVSRQDREVALLAGLDALDRWIADQVQLGLAGFAQRAHQSIRPLCTRLVDHKTQGLANRLDMLGVEFFRTPEATREDLLLSRLGSLALISFAYRNQAALPAALREDVRRAVGWTTRREEVLADTAALRVASTWLVLATRSEVQPDSLRRLETWLLNAAAMAGESRFALLTDYVPASAGTGAAAFAAGEIIEGEIAYYPSATPLRGSLNARAPRDGSFAWPPMSSGLPAGLMAYEAALARRPWIDTWPIATAGVFLVKLSADRLALADSAGAILPLDTRQTADAQPLLGLAPMAVTMIWDGCAATLLAADTAIGPWYGR